MIFFVLQEHSAFRALWDLPKHLKLFWYNQFCLLNSLFGGLLAYDYVHLLQLSKSVKGEEAYKLGLVDALSSSDELLKTARYWALEIAECRKPWIKSLYKTDKLESLGDAREILKFARAQAQKQAANLLHPLVCIDVIEEGIVSGPRAGLWKEVHSFQTLVRSDTCKSLVHVFFALRATSKV
ncbi:hypothetical protein ZIOFF_001532 [Zingiber officinale]|uniref:Uncharacterized protein n=1 Tax=Zingiber officinale TaxID=94328 RepID=A0A8J5LS66_ZINOF|nr:hypothetical protein ZIOFF_001532 [Zingiber officinale]